MKEALIEGRTTEFREDEQGTIWFEKRICVPLDEVQLESDLTYEEKPIKILETAERNTRTKTIKFCKVQWSHHTEEEATWERVDEGVLHLKGVSL